MDEYKANHGDGSVTANWSWHQAKGRGKMHDLIEAQRLPWDDEIERQAKTGVDRIEVLVQARTLPKKKPKMCSEQARLKAENLAQRRLDRLAERFRVTTRRHVRAEPRGVTSGKLGDAEGVLAAVSALLKVVPGVVDDVQWLRQIWVLALARGGILEKEKHDQKGLLSFRIRMPDGSVLLRFR